jgi:hypothetical protein
VSNLFALFDCSKRERRTFMKCFAFRPKSGLAIRSSFRFANLKLFYASTVTMLHFLVQSEPQPITQVFKTFFGFETVLFLRLGLLGDV